MFDELSISFQYSATDHAEALSHGAGQRKLRRQMRLLALFAVVVGALITSLDAMRADALAAVGLLNLLSWSAVGAVWFWAGPTVLKVATRWELSRSHPGESINMERITLGEEGFSPSPEWSQPMPWSFVNRVVETQRLLLIYHGYSTDPFYVPKHALSPLTSERVFVLLREQLKARPDQLQLLSRAT
jgi:hypothetical protein